MTYVFIRCESYLVQVDTLYRTLESIEPNRILLHAPDGLKHLYTCLTNLLVEKGIRDIVYSINPGYGACDIPIDEAELIGADLLVHLGHEEYPFPLEKPSIRVEYVPVYLDVEPDPILLNELAYRIDALNAKKISLSSTLIDKLIRKKIARYLREKGIDVVEVETPILGCRYNHVIAYENEIDAHIVVGGGLFHPLGLALIATKPILAIDPYMGKIWDPRSEAERIKKKRIYDIIKAKNSNSLGLITGTRPGQYRPSIVESLRKQAIAKGYSVYVISSSYISLERLAAIDNALNLDFYVVTSCPRLPIDDLMEFHKPVLTPGEFAMILRDQDTYIFPW